ncbi:Hypothetical predicted protein, partial [Podarcis lilfordi]
TLAAEDERENAGAASAPRLPEKDSEGNSYLADAGRAARWLAGWLTRSQVKRRSPQKRRSPSRQAGRHYIPLRPGGANDEALLLGLHLCA